MVHPHGPFGAWDHCVQAVFYVHRGLAGARVKKSKPGACIHGNMSVSSLYQEAGSKIVGFSMVQVQAKSVGL